MTKLIVCFHTLTPQEQQNIRKNAPGYTLVQSDAKSPDLQLLSQAEIVIGWAKGISDTMLAPDSPLRWVQTWSAGIERLPLLQFQERGIFLTNASGVHAEPISAVIFGYMLMFTRNLHTAIRNQEAHRWESDGSESELTDKTAVIVGTGAIGSETARIAKAFRMKTVGVSRSGSALPDFDMMYTTDNLLEAVSEGNFVINTLPLTDETHNLFNKSVFSVFKQDTYYINIGRGDTTNTTDLMDALNSGQLRGAGLDVFETEPLPHDHPLWDMKQVIITPHRAGNTDRYSERVVDIFVENMKSYINEGSPSRNVVDYNRQY
ncbi:NAD(P)-dependent oxidoreductase [Paenibacillus wynnii]|uniref:NAD(P)-dependent oxidoreductase n=1 Tax=Paenibacillus wynnii TaxID=268407 RepID=UPI00278D58AB|nr:NAD(P)-dependent oxidoreductase [Paenibacillus wynnii]MDQ0193993.1 phosphoglycerate dehydrogenase-like enzyme [Paenibacillus wynnii]